MLQVLGGIAHGLPAGVQTGETGVPGVLGHAGGRETGIDESEALGAGDAGDDVG